MTFRGCRAGTDGGGIYTFVGVSLGVPGVPGSIGVVSNSAAGSGGGIMAMSSVAVLTVQPGTRLAVRNNSAGLDGGGLGFEQGASVVVAQEGCSPLCDPVALGDGICHAPCMTRGCNW